MNVYVKALRAPFLSGSLTTVLAAAGLAYLDQGWIPAWNLAACLIGVAGLQLGANLFNDYCDAADTDRINLHPTPFSGGSRVIQDLEVSRKVILLMSLACLAVAFGLGLHLVLNHRPMVALWGLLGLAAGVFYSLRPIYLMGRGWGELTIFMAFGPLLTLGVYYALTGEIVLNAAWIGVPPGFLIAAVIWINEFPDELADRQAGKNNLVVRLGLKMARLIYIPLMLCPFASLFGLAFYQRMGWLVLMALAPLPLALSAIRILVKNYQTYKEVIPAQMKTIQTHAAVTLLLALALWGERFFRA